MVCVLHLKAIFFKKLVLGETGAWLIYLHLPLTLPYRATYLEGCLEIFTSTLLGLYPGKRQPRERRESSRDLELESRLGPESDFLGPIAGLSALCSKAATLH